MGKRNQERRRAKKKQRDARQQPKQEQGSAFGFGFGGCECGDPFCTAGSARSAGGAGRPGGAGSTRIPPPRGPRSAAGLLDDAMELLWRVPLTATVRREAALDRVGALFTKPGVGRAALAAGGTVVHDLWHRGWQPADVVRAVRRELKPRHGRIAVDLIAADHRTYPAAGLRRRWAGQLADLSARVWWEEDDGYVEGVAAREKCDARALGRAVGELLELLSSLPELPELLPPPCEPGAVGPGAEAGAPLLGKIRALLTKAESTAFPEEAEALTAKAQQLMAQHSIDAALLAAERGTRQVPSGVRVGMEAPYEEPKVSLLQAVAQANRCRLVWSRNLGFATLVGFAADLEAVELLYTSLLVQTQTALQAVGPRTAKDGASRTRSYRQSFLVAFAIRIDQRLARATRETTDAAAASATASGGTALLPVLASRAQAVDERVDEWFEALSYNHASTQASNHEGWSHGTAAADRAELRTRAGALGGADG